MSEPLSNDDFTLADSKMQLLRKGAYAALFMAKGDKTSSSLVQILKQIQVGGMATGYLDISNGKNKDVITMSRKTKAPITTVPYLAIFYEGKIKCRYKGQVDVESIRQYCQGKVIEFATEMKIPSQPKINSTNSQQFAMARATAGPDSKPGPDPTKAGMIGYNKAWVLDTAH